MIEFDRIFIQDVGGLESMRNLEQYLPGDTRNSGVFSPQDPSSKGNRNQSCNFRKNLFYYIATV